VIRTPKADSKYFLETVLVGVLGMRASLPTRGQARRGLRIAQVVPDLLQEGVHGIETGQLDPRLEMLGQNRHCRDELKSSAARNFEGAAVESVDLRVMQCIQTNARRLHGLRFLVHHNFAALVAHGEPIQQPVRSRAPDLEIELAQLLQDFLPIVVKTRGDHDITLQPLTVRGFQLHRTMYARITRFRQIMELGGADHPRKQILHVAVLQEHRVITRSQQKLASQRSHLVLAPAHDRRLRHRPQPCDGLGRQPISQDDQHELRLKFSHLAQERLFHQSLRLAQQGVGNFVGRGRKPGPVTTEAHPHIEQLVWALHEPQAVDDVPLESVRKTLRSNHQDPRSQKASI